MTREQYQRHGMLLAFLPSVLGVLVLWGLYLARVVGDVDLLNHDHGDKTPAAVYLYLALGGTVIGGLWLIFKVRSTMALMKHGVTAKGAVTGVSIIRRRGRGPVTFTYKVDGVVFTKRKDLDSGYDKGDTLTILYDPRQPKRCVVL